MNLEESTAKSFVVEANGLFHCRFCQIHGSATSTKSYIPNSKFYVREVACVKHVLREHKGEGIFKDKMIALLDEQAEAKKEMEKRLAEYRKTSAIGSGQEYFNNLKHSLKSALENVERYEKDWSDAVDGGTYPDGSPLGDELKVNEIVWCAHSVQQLNLHSEKAVRAAARIAVAFGIEL